LQVHDDLRRGCIEGQSLAARRADTVTVWIESLKAGDVDAAEKLWRRYFEDLVRLARDRLGAAPRAMADEEDAALDAFDSFVRGAARGCYPRLGDRDDLWRLLVVITERKVLDQARHERRRKRGGGKVVSLPGHEGDDHGGEARACLAGAIPTPEFAAMIADECRNLLGQLRDDSLRQVARLRMEGYTNEEVANRLGCSLRTVARKIEIIRRTWLGEEAPAP
jgi:DNA-directed RNA polymerase specialized sigma24 family protein